MAYDFYGGWSPTTGHTAICPQPPGPHGLECEIRPCSCTWLRACAQTNCFWACPFYARAWQGWRRRIGGLYQPYTSSAYEHGLSYTELQRFLADPSYKRFWDDTAKAAYLYNGQDDLL